MRAFSPGWRKTTDKCGGRRLSDSVRIPDRVCTVLIPLLLLVAGALCTGVSVVRELMVDHGRVVAGEDGEPVVVPALWESWKMDWLPEALMTVAAVCLLWMFYQEVAARYFMKRTAGVRLGIERKEEA